MKNAVKYSFSMTFPIFSIYDRYVNVFCGDVLSYYLQTALEVDELRTCRANSNQVSSS